MMNTPDWWQQPRHISVVVDNDSWIVPYAEQLVQVAIQQGDKAMLCRTHDDIKEGAVAFYLGCMKITPPEILARNQRNLVVHASDLPEGRGWSPLSWYILQGRNDIPVCLLEAADEVDSGPIIYKEVIEYKGHELLDELRTGLGEKTIALCLRFLNEKQLPEGESQQGDPSWFDRRRPEDSRLDANKSLKEQFNHLRIVDNDAYPAFFELDGRRYVVKIEER